MLGAALLVFVVGCVLPVAYLLTTTLDAVSTAGGVTLDERQRGLLRNTTVLGAGTAVLATAIGAPLGIVLARVPLRRKAAIRLLVGAPILLPPYIGALAWVSLASRAGPVGQMALADLLSAWAYSLPAAILILSLALYPLSMLATEVALRRIDGRLEEAALLVAPPHRVLWRITLPLAAPSIIAAALLIFVLAVSEFGVPGVLRVRVYTTEVFTAFAALYDFGRAIVVAAPLLMLCVCIATVAAGLLRDRLVTTRRSLRVSPVVFGAWRRGAVVAVCGVVAMAVAVPVLILIEAALGTRSLAAAVAGSGHAILNSLLLSATGATMVIAVAVCLGYALARAHRAIALIAQVVLVVLFAIPSTIVGVGLIGLWNRPGLAGALYGTEAMFLLVIMARFVPVAALIATATVQAVSVSQEEAAAVNGISWARTMQGIVLPQLRGGLGVAWVVTFVLAFGELGTSILVAPPGETTLPIRVYTIIANTPYSQIAVLALLQTFIVFIPLAVLGVVASWREVQ